jgi:hypothetical protein
VLEVTPAGGSAISLIAIPDAISATFAFDRTMQPSICWNTASAGAYFHWFNSLTAAYETTHYPLARNAMVIHDDTRDIASSTSDVMLFYQTEDLVCYRQQRDRYLIERVIGSGIVDPDIKKCGMCMDMCVRVKLS